MIEAPNLIVLVTPVWNDAARLEVFGLELAKALAVSDLSILWIVADDGSGESEQQRVRDLVEGFRAVYPYVDAMFLLSVREREGRSIRLGTLARMPLGSVLWMPTERSMRTPRFA